MGNYAKMLNRESVIARLAKLPAALKEAAGAQLAIEVDDMVSAQQRAAPVGAANDPHPGQFRDSIHSYPTPGRELSYRIIADAKDGQGRNIGRDIEFGHITPGGAHVAGQPSFFPTYRARKKPMRNRLNAVARKALKVLYPK